MPAPKFLAGLPKPLLFGLYGAVGGLIGAVLLGEPAWQLLKPPPPPPPAAPAPQVAVSAPPSVQIYPNTGNTFVVQIARAEFDTPVTVTLTNLPAGVTAAPVTVPAGQTQADVTLTANATALPATSRLTATAAGGGATATATLELVIAPTPPPPPRLAVAIAPSLQVYRRGACKFTVQVARGDFDGPVKVELAPLPKGVTAPTVEVPAGKTEIEVTLSTTDAAALGVTKLTATAAAVARTPLTQTVQTELVVMDPPPTPVDIMFVLDCTGSMEPFIEGVRDGIIDFAKELSSRQLDARVGLLAFRDRLFGQEPELLTFDQKPFTTDMKRFSEKVGRLRCIGNNTIPESSLDGTVEAARQPFREQGAAKVLLLITDAAPLVPDKETRTVKEAADFLKEKKIDQLHLVLRKQDVRAYRELHEAVPGEIFDLGRVTNGGEKFATILPELSKKIANTVAASPVKAEVAAAPPPPVVPAATAAKPTAAAAPAPPPAPAVKSLQSNEQAAAGSEGRLVLRSGVWAGAIAALVCLALLAGQHHYLRGSFPAAGGVVGGLLGGLAVGLVGGAAGQGLYLLAPNSEVLGVAFRVLGWALLGGLAGVGLSLFIPNMKWAYGLIGGAVGGAVGAAGFLAVSATTNDLAGRLIGGLVVGFCIGLMVAVVEAAFRRAWLEVRYGTRETILVNLGPEPVKVGGDSRACTVWARGAAPLALRFFVRDGQVICDDAVMKRESAVADGFAKEVGNVTVTVHTGNTTAAAPVAPTPPRPAAPVPSKPAPVPDDFDALPMPAARPTSPAPARPAVAVPAKPPIPAPSVTRSAPVAAKPAVATPSGPKSADACPTCGRVNPGAKKARYCMVCDITY